MARHARPMFSFATDRAIRDMTEADIERFFRHIQKDRDTGCWLWQSYRTPSGYGVMSVGNTSVRAHRIAYWREVGRLGHRVEVDHLCENRHCVNPDHLEAVTHAENVKRGKAGSYWASKTQCPKGHPYSGENVRKTRAGGRACKSCNAQRMRESRAAMRNAGATD